MILVANDKAAEVVEPGKQPLNLPAAEVTPQRSTVLRGVTTVAAVRRNHLHAALIKKPFVQDVAVVSFITDEPVGKIFGPNRIKGFVNESHLVGRGAGYTCSERNTMAVCDRHDLAALAAFGLSDLAPPFLAPEKEPSMKASERSSLPRRSRSSANTARILANTPARVHCWNRRWQVWYGGYRSGRSFQGAPVRKIHKMPLSTSRGSRGGRPRPPGLRRMGGKSSNKQNNTLDGIVFLPPKDPGPAPWQANSQS